MTTTAQSELLTTEQLDAMPEDGKERWLIRGELREKEMTKRNRDHSRIEGKIAYLLRQWMETQREPRGEVLVGEAGVRLKRNPDTTVGVDVAYVSAKVAAASPESEVYLEGAPVLVVEILSPSDKHEEIAEKVEAYLQLDVTIVWVVDPIFKTITVYRKKQEPVLFNITQTIDAEPDMQGFRVAVAEIFTP